MRFVKEAVEWLSTKQRQPFNRFYAWSASYPSIHTVSALDNSNSVICAAMLRRKKSNTLP